MRSGNETRQIAMPSVEKVKTDVPTGNMCPDFGTRIEGKGWYTSAHTHTCKVNNSHVNKRD